MTKSKILRVIAFFLLGLGGYGVYLHISSGEINAGILGGIGPLVMGFAMLLIAENISKKEKDQF